MTYLVLLTFIIVDCFVLKFVVKNRIITGTENKNTFMFENNTESQLLIVYRR